MFFSKRPKRCKVCVETRRSLIYWLGLFVLIGHLATAPASAARRKGRIKRYSGPPPTHPVVLWARTLSESSDTESKKVAAFKLSQYSQAIFQLEAIRALIGCSKHHDFELRVLCTKALGRAGNQTQNHLIRDTLVEIFDTEPRLRGTVIRTLIVRKDTTSAVSEKLLEYLKKTQDVDSLIAALNYFEALGPSSQKLVSTLAEVFAKTESSKVRRAIAKALSEQGGGHDTAIEILSKCGESKEDTPLILICLAGLQQQAKTDARTWSTIEKTLDSSDRDVQLAVVDLIIALPDTANSKIAERLLTIMGEMSDDDLAEKIVLSLGVVGNSSEKIGEALTKSLARKDFAEGIRIAAALTIAKQSPSQEKTRQSLTRCLEEEKSEPLRSACQLGMNELEAITRTLSSK